MFVANRRPDWAPIMGQVLGARETIEEMESWVATYMEGEPDGNQMYIYKVDFLPVMKYTVVHEIRGDAWDGPAK